MGKDLLFCRGPLDVLDHSSDAFSFGGKVGVDATIKLVEENAEKINIIQDINSDFFTVLYNFLDRNLIKNYNLNLFNDGIPVLIIAVNRSLDPNVIEKVSNLFKTNDPNGFFKTIIVVDYTVDPADYFTVAWQVLGNSDPQRDHEYISTSSLLIDGTIKAYRKGGFSRRWPNVVCSDSATISTIDKKWESLKIGPLIDSPSLKSRMLSRDGTDEILIN